jgi:hypothetical protein
MTASNPNGKGAKLNAKGQIQRFMIKKSSWIKSSAQKKKVQLQYKYKRRVDK